MQRKLFKNLMSRDVLIALCLSIGLLFNTLSIAHAQYAAFEDPQSASQKTSGPDLKPSETSIDGGNISRGDVSQVITVFKNVTNMPISVKGISLYPSANITATVGTDNCSKSPIPPSAECAITTNVTGISDGAYRVEILVDHDGRSRLSTTAVTGTVGGAVGQAQTAGSLPQLSAMPEEVDFEELETRTPLVRSVLLSNTTSNPIEISNVELMADAKTGFSLSAQDCKELEAGKGCLVTIMWTPYTVGKAEGVLMVHHNGPKGVSIVPIKGDYDPKATGVAEIFPESIPGKGLIISDRTEVDFGSEVDGAASITVSLVNTGDTDVELTAIKLAGSDNGLTLASDGCIEKTVLKPFEACPLTVNWSPRREGPIIDDIQIRHDGVRGVLVLPIRGEAQTPVVADQSLVSIQSSLTTGLGIPRLSGAELQVEKLDGKDVPKSVPVMTTSRVKKGGVASFDGYKVTSHASTRAVVTGPFGRMIVNDGELQMLGGKPWIVQIVSEGVQLIGDTQVVLLVFDKSFTTKIEKEAAQIVEEEDGGNN